MIKRVLCFQNPAYLSLKDRQIQIKLPETDRKTSVPVEDVGVVVLDNRQITITQALMAALLENNCALVTTNDCHLPVGMFLPLDGHSLQSERFRNQINASEPLKKQMWQQTVVQKILGQAYVLATQGVENRNMLRWAADVRSGDAGNLEGRAAAYYWKSVFTDNPAFIRGRDEDAPNNLLNYGYAIVRALMARSLVSAGLLPTFGIHHHNRYNAYCLADDIMEPYRPAVDLAVLDIAARYPEISEITPALKRELLTIPVRDVTLDGKRTPVMTAIQHTAHSVARCFTGESRKIIYPEWC